MDARLIIYFIFLGGVQGQTSLYNIGTVKISLGLPKMNNYPPENTADCKKEGCIGRVWIYFSDSGQITQWGTINGDGIEQREKEVLCRQLGYSGARKEKIEPKPFANHSVPVWLTAVRCEDRPVKNNILQCNYTICNKSAVCFNHSKDLELSCYGEPKEKSHYEGEVFLCPPKGKPPGLQTSLGLIQLYLYNETKSLALVRDPRANMNAAMDSLCRQLGFSGREIYYKISATQYFDFSNCVNSSWFDISQMRRCNGSVGSYPCFGCCYDYPVIPSQGCPYCTAQESVLLACNSKYSSHIDRGNQTMCEFNSNQRIKDGVCSHPDYNYTDPDYNRIKRYKRDLEASSPITVHYFNVKQVLGLFLLCATVYVMSLCYCSWPTFRSLK